MLHFSDARAIWSVVIGNCIRGSGSESEDLEARRDLGSFPGILLEPDAPGRLRWP